MHDLNVVSANPTLAWKLEVERYQLWANNERTSTFVLAQDFTTPGEDAAWWLHDLKDASSLVPAPYVDVLLAMVPDVLSLRDLVTVLVLRDDMLVRPEDEDEEHSAALATVAKPMAEVIEHEFDLFA